MIKNKTLPTSETDNILKIPSVVLFILGLIDLMRGIMHTFLALYTEINIAKLNIISTTSDQLFLMNNFGATNFITGTLYLLISRKAKELSPLTLITIPFAYFISWISMYFNHIHKQSKFEGIYFMFVYFAICIISFSWYSCKKFKLF